MGSIIIALLACAAKTIITEAAKQVPHVTKDTLFTVSKTVSICAEDAKRRANQVYDQTGDINEAVSELFGTRNT